MSQPLRILLVEDQTLMRQGLKTIIDLEDRMQVVGEASTGEEGVRLALSLRPDIVLMDIQMPGMNGVEATAAICAIWQQARVVILTTFDRNDYVFQAVRAGALGYVLKDTPANEVLQIIRQIAAGEVFLQPEIASRTLRAMLHPESAKIEPLSDRERQVLVFLAQGDSNRGIAEKLNITEGTVKNHVSNILNKLQAENRTQVADIARRHGLV